MVMWEIATCGEDIFFYFDFEIAPQEVLMMFCSGSSSVKWTSASG